MKIGKIVGLLMVVFLGFWVVTDPRGLANVAEAAGSQTWQWTGDLFRGLIEFLGALG